MPGKTLENSPLLVSSEVGMAAPMVQWPLSWVTDISRSMRFRSISTEGSGRPERIWGTTSVAPANTRDPGLSASRVRASSTVVGAAYSIRLPLFLWLRTTVSMPRLERRERTVEVRQLRPVCSGRARRRSPPSRHTQRPPPTRSPRRPQAPRQRRPGVR